MGPQPQEERPGNGLSVPAGSLSQADFFTHESNTSSPLDRDILLVLCKFRLPPVPNEQFTPGHGHQAGGWLCYLGPCLNVVMPLNNELYLCHIYCNYTYFISRINSLM